MAMIGLRIVRFIGAVILTLLAVLSLGRPAIADAPPPIVFDPGIACDFGLKIDFSGGHRVERVFTDKNGNPIRILSAGEGFLETFTNLDTGAAVTFKTGGSVSQTKVNPDGTLTFVGTGLNVIILFPTDVPAGPSTILYEGRFVATIDPTGVATVQLVRGTQKDICAALS
jgi:hypothetical protein